MGSRCRPDLLQDKGPSMLDETRNSNTNRAADILQYLLQADLHKNISNPVTKAGLEIIGALLNPVEVSTVEWQRPS